MVASVLSVAEGGGGTPTLCRFLSLYAKFRFFAFCPFAKICAYIYKKENTKICLFLDVLRGV